MNITIHICKYGGTVPLEMPGATTALYAAKRAADALGYEGEDAHWMLRPALSAEPLHDDTVMGEHDGQGFYVVRPRKG